ncbi:hypothetical protein [Acinetobacter baumannii]|uniref:hypothetical protein n=1 Tax=Acinetobacter baumannii TaxID=470 RepID=UPI001F3B57F0|nr:hypothetical protein [Acinetobacter baumannii]MDO7394675.1 hypothetical protein [Acinetobacter baumannii]UJX48808.1 hypothetical protein HUF98_03545 [Acinetobacter baumannii]
MKQRTIQSQTTTPCNTEPKPSDYAFNWREHVWAHLVDTLKMFAFLGFGLVVWIFFSFFLASLLGG